MHRISKPPKKALRPLIEREIEEYNREAYKETDARGLASVDQHQGIDSVKKVEEVIQRKGSADILDIGCGKGNFANELGKRFKGKCRVTVTDIRSESLEHARQRPFIHEAHQTHSADLSRFRDESFDLIFNTYGGPIHHLAFLFFIEEVSRVLRTGGEAVFTIAMIFPKDYTMETLIEFVNRFPQFEMQKSLDINKKAASDSLRLRKKAPGKITFPVSRRKVLAPYNERRYTQ